MATRNILCFALLILSDRAFAALDPATAATAPAPAPATSRSAPATATLPSGSEQRTTMLSPGKGLPGRVTPLMAEVQDAIERHDFATARAKLAPELARCEAQEKDSKDWLVEFADQDEFVQFSSLQMIKQAAAGTKKGLLMIDDDCAIAFKSSGYLYAEDGDVANGLRYLDMANHRAPFWAEVDAERGFLLMKSGNAEGALVSYKGAVDCADRFPRSAYVKPLALRGLGYVYVELGRLEEGRKAYQDSLVLEPGNQHARDELAYIDGLEKQKHP